MWSETGNIVYRNLSFLYFCSFSCLSMHLSLSFDIGLYKHSNLNKVTVNGESLSCTVSLSNEKVSLIAIELVESSILSGTTFATPVGT